MMERNNKIIVKTYMLRLFVFTFFIIKNNKINNNNIIIIIIKLNINIFYYFVYNFLINKLLSLKKIVKLRKTVN